MKKRKLVPIFFLFFHLFVISLFAHFVYFKDGNIPSFFLSKKFPMVEKICFFSIVYSLFAFISTSYMDPGTIKKGDFDYSQEFDDCDEKLFCAECGIKRPPRSHHCKTCGKCIALKDHHCYYLGNCIGIRNYRSFFLFLLSFLIHSITSLIIISDFLFPITFFNVQTLISLFAFLYFIFFTFSVLKQILPQISFLKRNSTWIESSKEKQKQKHSKMKQKVSRYDTGSLYENIKQKMGSNPLLWLFPIPNNSKIISFPQNPEYIPWSELDLIKEYSGSGESKTKVHKRNIPL